jgi:hypothetical protein
MAAGAPVTTGPSLLCRVAFVVGALAAFGACARVTSPPGVDASPEVEEEAVVFDAALDHTVFDATPDRTVLDAALDHTIIDAPMDVTSDPSDDVYCPPGRGRCIVCTSLVGAFVTRISGARTTFRFEVDGTWSATTETDALPTPTARGRFSLSGNRLSLWDDPLDGAPGACPADVEGVYGIDVSYSCGAFQLRRIRDDCPARASALTDAYFTR